MRCPAAVVLALLATAGQTGAQRPMFSTGVEAVRVDVLVTDDGRPIRNLGPPDFEVLDSGVAQQVDMVTLEKLPLNLVLTLDLSDSVMGERLDQLRLAAGVALDGLEQGDRAALVTFSHLVALRQGFTSDVGLLRRSLTASAANGDTALMDGSYTGVMLAESDAGRSLVIVFSDGVDTSSWLSAPAVLETVKRCNAVVYAVFAGTSRAPVFLRDLSAATGGSLFEVQSARGLPDVFRGILGEFRQRYLLSYTPRGVPKDGWHPLEVRVKGRHAAIKARPGYLAGPAATAPGR